MDTDYVNCPSSLRRRVADILATLSQLRSHIAPVDRLRAE